MDGTIIDLNRIPLPADTPIIDERFTKNGPEKRAQQSTSAGDRVGLEGDDRNGELIIELQPTKAK